MFKIALAGYLSTAKELGANKIALGHHRDDMVHTILNIPIWRYKIDAPKLVTLMMVRMSLFGHSPICSPNQIAKFARGMEFQPFFCNLCGSQENLQRQKIREMMEDYALPSVEAVCSLHCKILSLYILLIIAF